MAGFLGTLPDTLGGPLIEMLLVAVELRIGSAGFEAPALADSSPVLSPTATEAALGVGDVEARYDGFLATGGADGLRSSVASAGGFWPPVIALDGGGGGAVRVYCRGLKPSGATWDAGVEPCLRGKGGGGASRADGTLTGSSMRLGRLTLPGSDPGSKGGGSLLALGAPAELDSAAGLLITSYAELAMLDWDCLEDERGTDTQSGSSVGVNGLGGRLGLSTLVMPLPVTGDVISTRAGWPFASHHFCRSELAGGSPGSMASYPIRSSSSELSSSRIEAPLSPSSAFRLL